MREPKSYEFIDMYNSAYHPSAIHSHNTALVRYYVRYLLQKVLSVYEFKGLPETWAENYFKYVLFGYGYIAVFNTDKYGVICNQCNLFGYNVFYQPNKITIANPLLNSMVLDIGKNCEVIRCQPDYGNILDLVTTYADLMALCLETAGINLINSKTSFIFFAENKSTGESYKKLYDRVASGEPMSVIDKKLLNDDGTPAWDFFTQNVGQNYITDKVLNDMKTLEDQFNTAIGIPNANTQKRERMITDEVNANNAGTEALVNVMLHTIQEDLKKVNAMFNTDISVSYKYKQEKINNSLEVISNE